MEMKVALIDLSAGSTEIVNVPKELLRKYIGGSGLATYFLFQYGSPQADPLSPENCFKIMNIPPG